MLSIKNDNLIESKVTSLEDPRLSVIAYGLRNPWSCFFHKSNFVIPDVGNSHWEEVNVIENFSLNKEPVFLVGLGLKVILMQIIKICLFLRKLKMNK